MWKCDPENTLIYSCVAMVTEIIAPHGDKEPLFSEKITHEGTNGQWNVFNSLFYQSIHLRK